MRSSKNTLKEIEMTEEEKAELTDRALILLSFKDVDKQELRILLDYLGIKTLKEKENVLREIFKLIQEGIVYTPQGLAKIVDQGTFFNIHDPEEIRDIDLFLLRPYDKVIKEIQDEIIKLKQNKRV